MTTTSNRLSFRELTGIETVEHKLVAACVLFYPILVASVRHGASLIFVILILYGLKVGWSSWKNLEYDERKILMGFCIFAIVMFMSLINTSDLDEGLRRIEKIANFLFVVPMYLLLRRSNINYSIILLLGMALSTLVYVPFGWYQVNVLEMFSAEGAYHKIIFGDLTMLFSMLLIAAVLTIAKTHVHYTVGVIAALLAMYASIMSLTRGAWIVVPAIIVIYLWLFRKKIIKDKKIGFGLFLAAIVSMGIFWNLDVVKTRTMDGIHGLQAHLENPDGNEQWGWRLIVWDSSIEIFKRNPLFGTGLGDFEHDMEILLSEGFPHLKKIHVTGHAHNMYLDTLASTGLVGFTALIACVFLFPLAYFYRAWKTRSGREETYIALCGITTIICFAIFGISEGLLSRNVLVKSYVFFILIFLIDMQRIKSVASRNAYNN